MELEVSIFCRGNGFCCFFSQISPNFLSIDSIHLLPLNKEIYKRDFSKLNEEALISNFQQIDWSNMFHGMDNINDILSCFITRSNEIINFHVPQRELSRKEIKFRSKPWISIGLQRP